MTELFYQAFIPVHVAPATGDQAAALILDVVRATSLPPVARVAQGASECPQGAKDDSGAASPLAQAKRGGHGHPGTPEGARRRWRSSVAVEAQGHRSGSACFRPWRSRHGGAGAFLRKGDESCREVIDALLGGGTGATGAC